MTKIKPNDYILATKYSDGDPNDPWEVGFYAGEMYYGMPGNGKASIRYFVKDSSGKVGRMNGYRRIKKLTCEQGQSILDEADNIDISLYQYLKSLDSHICEQCDNPFTPEWDTDGRFCSDDCKDKYNNIHHNDGQDCGDDSEPRKGGE